MQRIFFYLIIILNCITIAIAQNNDEKSQLANKYYINGELEKANDIYKKLAIKLNMISEIHNNYFNTLLILKDYKTAEKYFKRILKFYPNNIYYNIDLGILYKEVGNIEKAETIFLKFINKNKNNQYILIAIAQYFENKQLTKYALKTFILARKYSNNKTTYALELANIYRILGNKTKMIDEYLTFASLGSNNLRYIKNILQNLLIEEKEIQNFQQILIDKIQTNPNDRIFGELLIWVNLQQKNFSDAFIQVKAIDKRFEKNGNRVLDIGKIALQNNAYDDAINIFKYVVENYANTKNYIIAQHNLILTHEKKVKNIFPIEKSELRTIANDYQDFINQIGLNYNTLEAYRNKALLHAFYLDEKDSAINILKEIINMPRVNTHIKSKCKIDLGDIYLLIGEPWEATLLYSQVEKTNKDSNLGYDAKLKNAKLNYFKGEFELAKSHLDILKMATSRDIANDALSLSLLIQDNTALDTSDFMMKKFANIELLLFQNKKNESIQALEEMYKNYPNHSLIDEILWKMANINMELGKFTNALKHLKSIQTIYGDGILGDDAMFLYAKIYEKQLKKKDIAMKIYNDFLVKYPGSVFIAEARKRFRKLRKDKI